MRWETLEEMTAQRPSLLMIMNLFCIPALICEALFCGGRREASSDNSALALLSPGILAYKSDHVTSCTYRRPKFL